MVRVFYQKKVFNNAALFFRCIIIILLFNIPAKLFAQTDASLSSLTVGSGPISPSFSSSTLAYTGTDVSNATNSVTVTATFNDPNASSITVNGLTATSGTPFTVTPLAFGVNNIPVVVTAQDGVTTQTYTISINRPKSNDATLGSLLAGSSSLSPTFSPAITAYSLPDVLSSTNSIAITPTFHDANAKSVTVNGVAATSGSAFTVTPLAFGVNTITIVVTAQDGISTQTYTVSVNRPKSSDATLSNLTASNGALSPTFSSSITSYTVPDVSSVTNSITITPTVNDPSATVTVNGVTTASGTGYVVTPLAFLSNTITIKVTAQDGTSQTYAINVNRQTSTDAALSNLIASNGALTPIFSPTVLAYSTPYVNTSINSITVTPSLSDLNASGITVNGLPATSGTPFTVSPLNFGANNISIKVTAQDHITTQTYTLTVNRPKSTDATLAALSVGSGALSPAFSPGITAYTVPDVSNGTTSIQIQPSFNSNNPTSLTVNGVSGSSGSIFTVSPLALGVNTISIVVTAQDGVTSQTYTVTVNRLKATDATLSALVASSGALSPTFLPTTYAYTLPDVSNSINSITITPTFNSNNPTSITVNGTTVTSGSPFTVTPLNIGINTINVTVTAQDGITTQTYSITVNKLKANDATLSNLTSSVGALSPNFSSGVTAYSIPDVSPTTTSITVTPTINDPNATSVTVNGVVATSGLAYTISPLVFGLNTITIKVTAQDGTTTQTYTISVNRQKSTDATLSNLTASNGSLTPAFSSGTYTYALNVSNATASITLSPSTTDGNATVTVNGTTVTSGTASSAINLTQGVPVPVSVVVTAQNGNIQTYTVNVTRALSADATLGSLTASSGSLSPTFSPTTTNYSLPDVTSGISSITITPTIHDANATSIKINGITATSGSAFTISPLAFGANTITIKVTAQDGTTTQTYTISVNRQKSTDATLGNLTASNGSLTPTFLSGTYTYALNVSNATASITLSPSTTDGNATVTVNGTSVTSGTASSAINLTPGVPVAILVVVTAQDGITTQTYTVNVTRALSADATLGSLTASSGSLSPTFSPTTTTYSLPDVSSSTNSITITPTYNDVNAKSLTVNGVTATSGSAFTVSPLAFGNNAIVVKVTAQDGVTTQTYTVNVNRPKSTDATLLSLLPSSGSLTPGFSSNITAYTVSVSNATSSFSLTPTTSDGNATITVNGSPLTSGSTSTPISLTAGVPVNITVVVTAQNSNTQTYTVTVTRTASAVSSLSALTVSSGSLSPSFNSGTTNYTVNVTNSTSSIVINATTLDNNASITVNGTSVASGSNSNPIPIGFGSNNISIVVTAQDGITKLTYNVNVTRPQSSEAHLSSLAVSSGTLSPTFTSNTLAYSINVPNAVNNITVTPVAVDNVNATIYIGGNQITTANPSSTLPLNVGSNIITVTVTAQDNTIINYTINITRAGSSVATLSGITLSNGTLSPSFNSGTNNYTASVANSVSSIMVGATTTDANATLTINGNTNQGNSIPLSVGSNIITINTLAQDGHTTLTYTIIVDRAAATDATLYGLTTSNGTLAPTFASNITSYNISVGNSVTGITVTPKVNDNNATVTVNGSNVTSGQSSSVINLNVGSNTITTVVTAQDGVTKQTYTITVTRAGASVSTLSLLTINVGSLSPAFQSGTYNYTTTVSGATSSIIVGPQTTDINATVKVNGAIVPQGSSSGAISLNLGSNTINTVVTAQDGVTTSTYTITVYRTASTDASLSGLASSGGALTPSPFSSTTYNYSQTVANSVNSIIITPTVTDANATIRVNGSNVASGQGSNAITLNVGTNTITVVTTAQDNVSHNTYTITVTRSSSATVTLNSLALSSGTLSPAFDPNTTSYTANVPYNVSNISVTAVTTVANSILRINGKTVVSGNSSSPISLFSGYNTITITVTAQDLSVFQTTTITIYRQPSSDASLSNLSFSGGAISPSFSSSNLSYSATVSFATNAVTVTPTSSDGNASITVNGSSVLSGYASSSINLNVGANIVTIYVLADDGSTNRTYTLTITRAASNDATLSGLTTSSGTLYPIFASGITGYTLSVGNSVSSITVTPTANDQNATIQVNGINTHSGNATNAINLNVGLNNIVVKVIAQDGTTTISYTLAVTKAANNDASLSALNIDNGTLSPTFSPTILNYTAMVNNTVLSLNLTPMANDQNATIRVNGNIVNSSQPISINLNVGNNAIAIVVTAQDGKTIQTYNLTINRQQSSDASLSNLVLKDGATIVAIAPDFQSNTLNYSANVSNTVNSITVTPNSTDPNAIIRVNGTRLLSGTTSQSITLNSGDNVISIAIQSQDHNNNQYYSVTVTKAPSSNAILNSITLSNGATLSPAFIYTTPNYNASVANTVTGITITPVAQDANAVITINGATVVSGTPSDVIPLSTGDNNITVKIISADQQVTYVYTIDVFRILSSSAFLSGLVSSGGAITPSFSNTTLNYTQNVPYGTNSIAITPTTPVADNSTLTVNGNSTSSGSSATVPLVVGVNNIPIVVTSQDLSTKTTYTLAVTEAGSPDATLNSLNINSGSNVVLAATGNISTSLGSLNVPNNYTSITINPSTTNTNATITVNGASISNGGTTAAIPLNVGNNSISILVTAQDGITTKTYTVTINRAAGTDATLSNLVVSQGVLSPAFSPSTMGYNLIVANSISTITLTPTANDPGAEIIVNGNSVLTGTASTPINLNVGLNTITTVVTATDNSTQITYTLMVTRKASSDAALGSLALNNGITPPPFSATSTTYTYTTSVDYNVSGVTFTPNTDDDNATVQINGISVPNGSNSGNLQLVVGANVFNIVVTAQDGKTTQTYTVIINRAASSDAALSSLATNNALVVPPFTPTTTTFAYSADVLNGVKDITFTPTTHDGNATVQVNGINVPNGGTTSSLPLVVGANVFTIIVTAQDGNATLTYTVTVNRAKSIDDTLSDLIVGDGSIPLSPLFSPSIISYTVTGEPNSASTITITPTTNYPTATVKVNGVAQLSGVPSAPITLNVGSNSIGVVVTAEDGQTKQTYSVNIQRLPSSVSTLSNLTLSNNQTLSPAFDPSSSNYNYTASVANSVSTINVIPTLTDNTATVMVNGVLTTNGSASSDITLNVGTNVIHVDVTGQDANPLTATHYTITINRVPSTVVTLNNIMLSSGTISPNFDPNIIYYTATVNNGTSSITITPIPTDPDATITVNGIPVLAGTPSAPVSLIVGVNTLLTVVVAQDGIAQKTYTIAVTRSASSNADINTLLVNGGGASITLTPAFSSSGVAYTANVPYSTSSVDVTATLADPNATMALNGQVLASGATLSDIPLNTGSNTITDVVTAQDGTTTKTYTITITRTGSSDGTLSSLAASVGSLVPDFDPNTLLYTINVDNSITSISLIPTLNDPNAIMTIKGKPVISGTASSPVAINVGNNTINVRTTAQDGVTKVVYKVVVVRAFSNNAMLSNLSTDNGDIGAFNTNLNAYSTTVANGITSVNVSATVADNTATVMINGNLVPLSGSTATSSVPLIIGNNTINILVTAQDGITTNMYSIVVTRQAASDASMSNIVVNQGVLNPAFDPGTNNYTVEVPFLTNSIIITPTVNDPNATVSVNAASVNSGSASAPVPLLVGANIITVTGTAQDLQTTENYTITVTRDVGSAINTLSNLTVSSGALNAGFASGTNNYEVDLPFEISNITFTPTLTDNTATYYFNFNGVKFNDGSNLALLEGKNEVDIVVTAQDGVSVNTYTVFVYRLKSITSSLSNITFNNGVTFDKPFDGLNLYTYTATASYDANQVTVTPTSTDTKESITVNGVSVPSGSASNNITLMVGNNTITVVSTAQDGINTSTYTITVVRKPSPDATLSTINIDGAQISGFSPSVLSYVKTLSNSSTSIAISATTNFAGASYTINDNAVAAGTDFKFNLNPGKNYVTILVVAADPDQKKTYTVEIDRPLESQTLTFAPTKSVSYGVQPFDPGATVTSGLPITYTSSDPTVATIVSGLVNIIKPGTTTITASVNDNSNNYQSVVSLSQVLVVTKANQKISGFSYPKLVKGGQFLLDGVTTNAIGVQVQFKSSDSTIVSVQKDAQGNPSYLEALELGLVTITASQPGNDYYNAAQSLAFTIKVEDTTGTDLVVHQAITPNGDGRNDYFKIEGITNYSDNSVTIVNPYGIKVYYEKSYDNDVKKFDGHSNITGQFLPAGTYFYLIKYSNGTTSKQQTGYIVLKY